MTAAVPDLDDVGDYALGLAGVAEADRRGSRIWQVGTRTFAWERPYTKADLRRFGDSEVPAQPVVAIRLADLSDTQAVLAEGRAGVFTMEHFDGFPAVLVSLPAVNPVVLGELLTDGWHWARG